MAPFFWSWDPDTPGPVYYVKVPDDFAFAAPTVGGWDRSRLRWKG